MIGYTNLKELSAGDLTQFMNDLECACDVAPITISLTRSGDIHIVSPHDVAWTHQYLLVAAHSLPLWASAVH